MAPNTRGILVDSLVSPEGAIKVPNVDLVKDMELKNLYPFPHGVYTTGYNVVVTIGHTMESYIG